MFIFYLLLYSHMDEKKKRTAPYLYVRFKWGTGVEIEKISEDLDGEYELIMRSRPTDEVEIALHREDRNELEVKSDTLTAMLSSFRATLSQKISTPFTHRDMELRKLVSELYPRERPTPFPWMFSSEPEFERAVGVSH